MLATGDSRGVGRLDEATENKMKHVRMLGLLAAMSLSLPVGCKSDDDPVIAPSNDLGMGGARGSGGVSSVGGTTTASDAGDPTTDADAAALDAVPDIIGTYTDEWGMTHQVTKSAWIMAPSIFHITTVNNAKEFLIASNDSSNAYNRDKWSRFDWTRDTQGNLYYCQTAYDAATEQQAEATPRADDSDPGTKGCGSFHWTKLTPSAQDGGA